jgi:hypothetical protein
MRQFALNVARGDRCGCDMEASNGSLGQGIWAWRSVVSTEYGVVLLPLEGLLLSASPSGMDTFNAARRTGRLVWRYCMY